MRTLFVAVIAVCQISVVPLAAQDLSLEGLGQQDARPEPSIAKPIVFGALLGAGSWLAGGLIGYGVAESDSCSGDAYCGLGAFLVGAAIGGSSGLALGMHLGNNRRGSFPLDLLTSVGIWGAGIGIVLATDDGGDVFSGGQQAVLVAIPVTQFALTLVVERATGRSRARRDGGMGLAVVPRPDGGWGAGLSLPLK